MKKTLMLLTAITACFATATSAYMEDCCLPPLYVGVDLESRHMPLQQNFGGNLYKKNYPQANFYAGLKGNDYFGIEAGYEVGKTKTRTVFLPSGSQLLGQETDADTRINTLLRSKGLHGSLLGFFPIPDCENFQILAGIGITHLKLTLKFNLIEANGIPLPPGTATKLTLSESKYILRLMTGLQYMFNDTFGLRANLRWENTSKFKNIQVVRSDDPFKARAKDSILFGLGIILQY